MEQDGEDEKFLNLFLAGKCLFEVRSRQSIGDVGSRLLNRLKDLTRYNLGYSYKPYESYSQEIDPKNAALVREIRTQALEVVAATWRNERFTYNWLKQRAKSDDDWNVRREALRQIATGWKDESGILDLLKQWLESDSSWNVRREALRQIATGWKDESGILDLLKQRVESDNSWNVRLAAVRQIATGWKNEEGILELFYNTALNDLFQRAHDYQENPRQIALEAIVKQYPEHPQTLPLLQDRAANDPDEKLREWAKKKLQRSHGLWHGYGYIDEAD
ncbi:MAG: HEAT repeat domain-containing protein [Trichodesmium sp. MO_231.B1]|nr:HEAT repeat domain-containing protein [Trichodesmium sp. MO_231.B1]